MSLIKHKKVELPELFYDLVFVYAISKSTALIHHLHHGVLDFTSIITFALAFIILINSWMVQTVYINRYGKNSFIDTLFIFLEMMLLLVASNSITSEWTTTFKYFLLSFSAISLLLMIQYTRPLINAKSEQDKTLPRYFIAFLAFRGISLAIASLLPVLYGSIVAILTILISWWLPSLFRKKMYAKPIIFPHLSERISLLVIITFGEMIINIAHYFEIGHITFYSILIFGIVASLFVFYILQIDTIIDEDNGDKTGVRLIYLHYLIFFGLSLTTVSLSFIAESEANKTFAALFLFTGLLFFYSGILLHYPYNKEHFKYSKNLIAMFIALFVASFAVSMLLINVNNVLFYTVFLLTTLSTTLLLNFTKKHQPQN